MDGIQSIIMLIIWIFVINLISRFLKKMFGKSDPNNPESANKPKGKQTFQDIFKELQKKMEDAQAKQNIPPYGDRKVVTVNEAKPISKKPLKSGVDFQKVYQSRDGVSEKEKKSNEEYKKFIRDARNKEHDATASKLDGKIYDIEETEQQGVPFELDLRNAIIGSIILERPYS